MHPFPLYPNSSFQSFCDTWKHVGIFGHFTISLLVGSSVGYRSWVYGINTHSNFVQRVNSKGETAQNWALQNRLSSDTGNGIIEILICTPAEVLSTSTYAQSHRTTRRSVKLWLRHTRNRKERFSADRKVQKLRS
ncbi:hypothetical protein SLA2020_471720 [Shorea laevis]